MVISNGDVYKKKISLQIDIATLYRVSKELVQAVFRYFFLSSHFQVSECDTRKKKHTSACEIIQAL